MDTQTNPKRRNIPWGALSTILVMIGAPLVVLCVQSPVGWVIYAVASVAGIVHLYHQRDRAMLAQFFYYLVMNAIAVLVRVIA